MKRYIKTAALAATLFGMAISCQEPIVMDGLDMPAAPEGYVRVSFKTDVPDMPVVMTKVVDPDGEDINNLTLFCFNHNGLFISAVTASVDKASETPSLRGTYDASIPVTTDRIHFVANQNMGMFDENTFVGKTEFEALSAMEGSSGMMIYWARVAKGDVLGADSAPLEDWYDAVEGDGILQNIRMSKLTADGSGNTVETTYPKGVIMLTRNHARIKVVDENLLYSDLGFVAVNTNAFGTVAPYNDGVWEVPSLANPFVTIPHNEAKLSDIHDVRNDAAGYYQYVFETENSSADPVSVIIRGTYTEAGLPVTKYFRVMLIDTSDEFIPIMRNHTYTIYIKGELEYGQNTFEEALTAPATNNVWLSVSDDVKEVRSVDYSLAVDQTYVVLGKEDINATAERHYTLSYTLKSLKSGVNLTSADKPEVTWLDGNDVASNYIVNDFSVSGATGNGNITVTLNQLGSEPKREGTLLVKCGPLQRKIKIITINTMEFTPSWVSTEVYSVNAGANMTMMFHIPENCPEELFPMEILLSVNDLDVRSLSGQKLPVRLDNEEGYDPDGDNDAYDVDGNGTVEPGEKFSNGYKYVYTATAPGVQRIYLESILSQTEGSGKITVEANYFTPMTKTYTFSNVNNTISFVNMHKFDEMYATGGYAADEAVFYYLVPQKVNAPVKVDLSLNNPAAAIDEFLLYSTNLDHITPGVDFEFYPMSESLWGTGGRVFMFHPLTADQTEYSIYMKTNTPVSEEVVRISSNQPGSNSGLPAGHANYPADGKYAGKTYRSITFELANYHPFRFHASVAANGAAAEGASDLDGVTDLYWTYQPGQNVDVEFDITSFTSTHEDTDFPDISVDPFGTSFEVYIDAPMLEIDGSRLAECNLDADKLRKHPTIEGRFVYTVDASRDAERSYGLSSLPIVGTDSKAASGAQLGERKRLPFKTREDMIVTAGDIRISSQESKVVYYQKSFEVKNRSITGTIKYGADAGSAVDVPAHSFVPMELVSDQTRIGTVTIAADGSYELRLRAEYDFNWNIDKIQFDFLGPDSKEYKVEVNSLADLFASPDVVLLPVI